MPRQTQKRIKGQKQVVAQETFDFTVPGRGIHARPVDPYAPPGRDPKVQNILTFMEMMRSTMRTGVQLGGMVAKEQRVKGKAARGRGEDAPEDAHWAFLEGHEQMSGAAAAFDYEQEMTTLLETNWRDDPQTFVQKKDAIAKQYLNGATDAFIEGFIPRSMSIEGAIEKEYQGRQHKILQEEFLTKSTKILKLDIETIISDDTIPFKQQSKVIREAVSRLQEHAKEYGLSRKQVSEAILKTVGSNKAMTGQAQDLLFLFEPGSDGVAIADDPRLANMAYQYIQDAVSTRQSLEKEARAERKRVETEFALKAGKGILEAIEQNQPGAAHKLLEDTGHFMGYDMYKGLKKALNNMREGSDTFFGNYTDHTTFDVLRVRARSGQLTLAELEKNQGALTKGDYRAVFADYIHHMDKEARESAQAARKSITETTMERTRSAGRSVVVQKDTLDRILNPETAPLRAVKYEIYFGDLYNDLVTKRQGRANLTAEDMQYAADKAIYMSFIDYEPRNQEKMPPDPDAKTKPQEEKKTTQSDDLLDRWLEE